MANLVWTKSAERSYNTLRTAAENSLKKKQTSSKLSKTAALFKQVKKTIDFLKQNPHHPGLHTHKFVSIDNPYDTNKPVFEAYAQNKTPGAYRIFWCYGPGKQDIIIIAITPHP